MLWGDEVCRPPVYQGDGWQELDADRTRLSILWLSMRRMIPRCFSP